ncbi:hypothetical protein HKBW3S25_01825, partial [Candidatus Hakubella thermalkaliphila]
GRKHDADIIAEETIGTAAYNTLDWMRQQTGIGMTAHNVSVSITQLIPIAQAFATTSKPAMLKAAKDIIANVIKNDGIINQSDLLTRRFGYAPLSRTLREKGIDTGFWLLRVIDRYVSQLVVRSKYIEGIEKGFSHKQAMAAADDWGIRTLADRSIGALPTLFGSRFLGPFTQYMLEPVNFVNFLLKDIPASNKTKKALALAVTEL